MAEQDTPQPITLHIPPSLQLYNKSAAAILTDREAQGVATGGYIFAYAAGEQAPRLLIVQREPGDGRMANLWEVPGGGCEDSDPTVIHGIAREVFEEVGLHVTRAVDKVGPDQYFHTRSGLHVVKLAFEVEVQEPTAGIALAYIPVEISHEHQQFAWVTEQEVADEHKYPMTDVIQRVQAQEAFRLHKTRRQQSKA